MNIMDQVANFLRDPIWQGIAGIIAVLVIATAIIRYITNLIRTRQNPIQVAIATFRELAAWLTRFVGYVLTRNWKFQGFFSVVIYLTIAIRQGLGISVLDPIALIVVVAWFLMRTTYISGQQLRDLRKAVDYFDYGPRTFMNSWKSPHNWSPKIDKNGLQLVPHERLSKILLLEEVRSLTNGTIECEVYLDQEALFDVLFRGFPNEEFYMARFDARAGTKDCILFKPSDGNWKECNDRKSLMFTSPHGQWLTMRVIADNGTISLYRDGVLVDCVNGANVRPGRIGMFAEVANVYVRRVRIFF